MKSRKQIRPVALVVAIAVLSCSLTALAATEQQKRVAINAGLAYLAQNQQRVGSGSTTEGYWPYDNTGTIATTAAAALAFIEDLDNEFLPGQDVIIDGVNYGDVVGYALNYLFNHAAVDSRFGVEYAGYTRYAEDYNNDGVFDDGNNQAIYFEPGVSSRRLYTTGICVPVIYALGERLGRDTEIDRGSAAINGKTYAQAMQDLIDWFSFAQIEPSQGNQRGGWRYDANWSDSDNSTAQWGALPLLYGIDWGLGTPNYVFNELELWVNYIQNANGGSGYTHPWEYVNVSKTGGLLLQLRAIGAPLSDTRVQNALNFINARWITYPSDVWYGNLNHPYAMWAVYKGLDLYGLTDIVTSDGKAIFVGAGMPAAPGGFTIGFSQDPLTSLPGDWYSHYADYLVGIQNANGSWSGYYYWTGYLATGWYINIIRASGFVPPPYNPKIELTATTSGPCVRPGEAVALQAHAWYGTPGFPDPEVMPAEGVEIAMTLSQHLVFVTASEGYQYDEATNRVSWNVGLLPDGAEHFVTVATMVANTAPPSTDLIVNAVVSASNVEEYKWGRDRVTVRTCELPSCLWTDATVDPLTAVRNARGVAWGDYDGNGYQDLFVAAAGPNLLFSNDGGAFTQVAWQDAAEQSRAATWVDFDNDGDLDLYVVNNNAPNRLYRNDGGSFSEIDAGPANCDGPGYTAAWADIDLDGDLDLFIANNGAPSKLIISDNGSFFAAVSVVNIDAKTRGCAFGDYDNDGYPDLYLSCDGPNYLFRNEQGVFSDVTADPLGDAGQGKGVAWGDYDNDGDLDLYLVNQHVTNRLFRNDGDGGFADVTDDVLAVTFNGRDCAWGDFDNDGWLDIYVTNAYGPNRLLRNVAGAFTEVSCGPLLDYAEQMAWGCAFVDFDNEGDLDLSVAIWESSQPSRLFRNEHGVPEYRWLQVDLRGVQSNRFGVGAKIFVHDGGNTLLRVVEANSGYTSQGPLTASFGLGGADAVDVTVHWPSGIVQIIEGVPTRQKLLVTELAGATGVASPVVPQAFFARIYPNPFNPTVTIELGLPQTALINANIYDLQGKRVKTLCQGVPYAAGQHALRWSGVDDQGRTVRSGIYIYRVQAGDHVSSGRMTLLK